MKLDKFKSVKMSMMEMKSDINESTGKADYVIKGSSTFQIPPDFYVNVVKEEKDDLTAELIEVMFEELSEKIIDVDTVGLWIDYNDKIFENSIKLETIHDMKKFGAEDVQPVYEFFKMTVKEK